MEPENKRLVEQKLQTIGSGLGVTIPASVLQAMGAKEGDTITFDVQGDDVVIKKKEAAASDEFSKLVRDVADKNDSAMKALVKR